MEHKPTKITVQTDGKELSLTTHWDADIFEWAESFKTILHWLTFDQKLIREILRGEYDEDWGEYGEDSSDEKGSEV